MTSILKEPGLSKLSFQNILMNRSSSLTCRWPRSCTPGSELEHGTWMLSQKNGTNYLHQRVPSRHSHTQ